MSDIVDNPYRRRILPDYYHLRTNHIRWNKTLDFLKGSAKANSGLDIGDRTPLTDQLEKVFGCKFKNTSIDLDTESIEGQYDVITAFEIIEHLFNPLHCLEQIREALTEDGRLFLSTPVGKPYFLWAPSHYHEIHPKSIYSLFNRAQFIIIRKNTFRIHNTLFYFSGLRPLLRGLFEKVQIFELRPDR